MSDVQERVRKVAEIAPLKMEIKIVWFAYTTVDVWFYSENLVIKGNDSFHLVFFYVFVRIILC